MFTQKYSLRIVASLGVASVLYWVVQSISPEAGVAFQFSNPDFLTTEDLVIEDLVIEDLVIEDFEFIRNWQISSYIPPDRGTPDDANTRSGAQRDDCGNWDIPLATLVPSEAGIEGEDSTIQSALALTAETHPVFWFYVPELSDELTHIDFELQNQTQTYFYQDQIPIQPGSTPGIVGFRLPTTEPALVPDIPYIWIVSVTCDPQEPAPFAEAWIERTSLEFNSGFEVSELSRPERVRIYGENGLLHEFISDLAWLKVNFPEEYNGEWIDFLEEINLKEVSNESIIQLPVE